VTAYGGLVWVHVLACIAAVAWFEAFELSWEACQACWLVEIKLVALRLSCDGCCIHCFKQCAEQVGMCCLQVVSQHQMWNDAKAVRWVPCGACSRLVLAAALPRQPRV
jgi:hypothetical protein